MAEIPSQRSPLLMQPFRLLFMGAALVASADIAIWATFLHLGLFPATALPPLLWHGHEMLFGFAGALIGGFLLTAVPNWTGLPTTVPTTLAALVLLWLAARVAFLVPSLPYAVAAGLDCAYFPFLAVLVGIPIVRKRDYWHLIIIAILLAYSVFDLLFHLSAAGRLALSATVILKWVIDLLTVMMLVVGGRIIPFFTERRISGIKLSRPALMQGLVDGGAMVVAIVDIAAPASKLLGLASLVLALLAVVRLYGWRPWAVFREPMLWVLHLGYLWLAAGLALRAVALLTGNLPEITALHAVTTGALGSLSLGMMTRVPLGHTGRALTAGKAMTAAFILVNAAAVLRVGVPGLLPAAGLLWAAAFALYFVRFLRIHLGPLRAA